MMLKSRIYDGVVVHRRHKPRSHKLRYRVFYLLIDLDELDRGDVDLGPLRGEKSGLMSIFSQDHGPGDGKPLRPYVEHELAQAGIYLKGGAIRLMTLPRVVGYLFNPLCVYFCYDADKALRAILYEVQNAHRERHTYVIPVTEQEPNLVTQTCSKSFYVSPFIPMACEYHFNIVPPGERLCVAIRQSDQEGRLLDASFVGSEVPMTAGALWRRFFGFPLLTFKVTGGILWEALRLYLKGTKWISHKAPPRTPTSLILPPSPQAPSEPTHGVFPVK